MKLLFSEIAWREHLHWRAADPAVRAKLNGLLQEYARRPFAGLGKPEPLKRDLMGWWSRRLTQSDRLVHRVRGSGENQVLEAAQRRFHYER